MGYPLDPSIQIKRTLGPEAQNIAYILGNFGSLGGSDGVNMRSSLGYCAGVI